jgi:mRNA interferase MazF
MAKAPIPKRGEIWLIDFDPAVGAEIRKARPAVVMSDDSIGRLPLKIVVPVTDWQPRYAAYPWFVELPRSRSNGLHKDSGADAFQVKSLSQDRFVRLIGTITSHQVDAIAEAIALCVGTP